MRISERSAMQKAAEWCREWTLDLYLHRWRSWWSSRRVKNAAVENELRELLAGGRKWADKLIGLRGASEVES